MVGTLPRRHPNRSSYTEDEAAAALGRAQATLPDEYRGDNMPFGPRLEIADDAPAIDPFVAWPTGRDGGGCARSCRRPADPQRLTADSDLLV